MPFLPPNNAATDGSLGLGSATATITQRPHLLPESRWPLPWPAFNFHSAFFFSLFCFIHAEAGSGNVQRLLISPLGALPSMSSWFFCLFVRTRNVLFGWGKMDSTFQRTWPASAASWLEKFTILVELSTRVDSCGALTLVWKVGGDVIFFFLFWEAGGVNRVEWFRIFRNLFRVASSVEKLDLCRGKDLGNLGWNGS